MGELWWDKFGDKAVKLFNKMRIILIIFALSFLTSCAVNPVTGKQDFVVMSENQEIQMGREYNAQILRQNPVYQDQELQDYVQDIGESLCC